MNKQELTKDIRALHRDNVIFADLPEVLNTFYMNYDDLIDLLYALNQFTSIDADRIEKELDNHVDTIKSAIEPDFKEKRENGKLNDTPFKNLDFNQLNQDQILEYYENILNNSSK